MGIPVMGHLGLTPQSIHKLGAYGLRAVDDGFLAKFLRTYADLHGIILDAVGRYVSDVKACSFPAET